MTKKRILTLRKIHVLVILIASILPPVQQKLFTQDKYKYSENQNCKENGKIRGSMTSVANEKNEEKFFNQKERINQMAIRKENRRVQSTLNLQQQTDLSYLTKKYDKSESKIMAIGLELLAAQDRAGFDIPKLKK